MIPNNSAVKKDFFYLSGIIAFSFYAFCFVLFALYLNTPEVKKFDAFKKTTVLELDITLVDNSTPKKRNKAVVKNIKKSEEIVKKSASKTAKQSNNVKSLFSKVKVNSKKVLKKEVTNVTKSAVASRFKSKFEKQRKSSTVSVSKLLDNVKSKATIQPSKDSKNNNDPYFSKIYELLTSRWQPVFIIDGLSAKVIISITSDGTFNYRIRSYSRDERFDTYLKSFLEEQITQTFPSHDRNSTQEIEIIFGIEKG